MQKTTDDQMPDGASDVVQQSENTGESQSDWSDFLAEKRRHRMQNRRQRSQGHQSDGSNFLADNNDKHDMKPETPKSGNGISIRNVVIGVVIGLFVLKVILDHWTADGFKWNRNLHSQNDIVTADYVPKERIAGNASAQPSSGEDDVVTQAVKETVKFMAEQQEADKTAQNGGNDGRNATATETAPSSRRDNSAAAAQETAVQSDKALDIRLPGNVVMTMQWIPHGVFTMGSPEGELGKFPFEDQHRVTLTKDFYLGKYTVTQAQWKAVMGSNPSHFQLGGDYPVEMISWKDAKAFCEKLNQLPQLAKPEGYRFDLPTEAQWEYACRAGTTSSLNNGTNLTLSMGECPNLAELAWFGANSGKTTHPVGKKQPNAWGLYDMHGNVWEWCRDSYSNYDDDCVDPFTGEEGFFASEKMYRGGCYELSANFCRSARRANNDINTRKPSIGFRLALVPID